MTRIKCISIVWFPHKFPKVCISKFFYHNICRICLYIAKILMVKHISLPLFLISILQYKYKNEYRHHKTIKYNCWVSVFRVLVYSALPDHYYSHDYFNGFCCCIERTSSICFHLIIIFYWLQFSSIYLQCVMSNAHKMPLSHRPLLQQNEIPSPLPQPSRDCYLLGLLLTLPIVITTL